MKTPTETPATNKIQFKAATNIKKQAKTQATQTHSPNKDTLHGDSCHQEEGSTSKAEKHKVIPEK